MQSGREEKLEMTFEESFDVFGGTLRPIMDPSQEFERMKMGSLKLLETNPANIVKLMARGTKQAEEDYTHALFSELGEGGSKEEQYEGNSQSRTRRFRSGFSQFWFRQHVAPRILFKHYTADILSVLYVANQVANGGQRGWEFEEIFHKLLPLGNWATKDLPFNKGVAINAWHFLANHFGWHGGPSEEHDSSKELSLMNVPVVKRGEDETDEEDLDEKWNRKFGGKKDGDTAENLKVENRRDVAKLIATCKEKDEFYWLPHGPHFPGLDSVHKNASALHFYTSSKNSQSG